MAKDLGDSGEAVKITLRLSVIFLVFTFVLTGCTNSASGDGGSSNEIDSTSAADTALQLAFEACTRSSETGGPKRTNAELAEEIGNIAGLAAEAAALDVRWRTLADHAASMKSGIDLVVDLSKTNRDAGDSELELITQVQADISKFMVECAAVESLFNK